jgi:ferric-dicitrate binding protein FerR (iron transport regulator)
LPVTRPIFLSLVLLSLLLLPLPTRAAESRVVEIRVTRNDNLINLCKKYLQHPGKWQEIARLNRLAQPDRLAPGQTISVPVDMLRAVPLEARVTFLSGTGFLKRYGKDQWLPLQQGDLVRVGESLKSGPGSSVEVAFADGSQFLLRENSEITVKVAQGGVLHLLRVLYLEAGKVITRVKKATGRDSRFEIETPSALAAARGTEYRVGLDDKATTRAELLESSISFSSMGATVPLGVDEGSVARFQEPPSPARKLLPPPEPVDLQQSYPESPLALRFGPVEDASGYRAVLARDREGKDAVKEGLIRPGDDFLAAPEADGTYYLLASSIDSYGLEGRSSAPREVVLRKVAKKAAPPVVAGPFDAARLQATRTTITWQKVPGAACYQLQIAAEPNFSRPVADQAGIEGTEYATGALTTGDYFVRLRAGVKDGSLGEWSPVSSFTILQLPAPVLRKAKNAVKGWDFAWDPLQEGISCQLQLAADPGFATTLLDRTQPEPQLHLDSELPPGTYYARVRGVDPQGHAGSFSEVANFRVEKPARTPYEWLGVGLVLLMFLL